MQDVAGFSEEFRACRDILHALGDKNRQHLILMMLQIGECNGVRVGAITKTTHLSRPAVSHHLRILKDAGIVRMRREGTKNFYYFDADTEALTRLIRMLQDAKEMMEALPNRSGKEQEN